MVRAREQDAAGDVSLRGCDVAAEGRRAGERLGARIASQEYTALHFDARCHTRQVRSNLDDDLSVVGQPEPYHRGEVTGLEDLTRWRAAQMLCAPLGQAGRVDSMHAR